jgi:GNAT acetyltransferase-like protein
LEIVSVVADEWKDLVNACPYATYFHHPTWFALLTDVFPEWDAVAVLSRDPTSGGRVLLPLIIEGLRLRSSPTTLRSSGLYTYGGPIADLGVSSAYMAEHVSKAVRLRKLRAGYAELYGNPYRDFPTPDGFSGREVTTHVVKLSADIGDFRTRYSTIQRRGLKSCEKAGVTIRAAMTTTDWAEYFRCYRESLARWDDRVTSRYTWELFERLRQEPRERVTLWLAEVRGVVLAGAIVLLHGKNVYYWHGAMGTDAGKIMPSRKLWDHVFECYRGEGFETVDMLSSGGHEGVVRFKESLGGEPVGFRADSWRAGLLRRGVMKVTAKTMGMMDR